MVVGMTLEDATTYGMPQRPTDHQWDINDSNLPTVSELDPYQIWTDGHCRYVYSESSEEAKRHASGWAMRNTNNHNVNILKKSCLGVLICSRRCRLENGDQIHLRPAICDKARKKQYGKRCPNSLCSGWLELLPCRGHCGYPVTHFWRHTNGAIYFQGKGTHDHPRPELKSSMQESKSKISKKLMTNRGRLQRKRPSLDNMLALSSGFKVPRLHSTAGQDVMCSCPPFECLCYHNTTRSSYDRALYQDIMEATTFSPRLDPFTQFFMQSPGGSRSQDHIPSKNILSKYGAYQSSKYEVPITVLPNDRKDCMFSNDSRYSSDDKSKVSIANYPQVSESMSPGTDNEMLRAVHMDNHASPKQIEEADLTNPGDFLSLNKPINNNIMVPKDPYRHRYTGFTDSNLPSIKSMFRDQSYESREFSIFSGCAETYVHAKEAVTPVSPESPLRSQPSPCSPPSLIELKPMSLNKSNMPSQPLSSQEVYQSKHDMPLNLSVEKSAFQPYLDHCTSKDLKQLEACSSSQMSTKNIQEAPYLSAGTSMSNQNNYYHGDFFHCPSEQSLSALRNHSINIAITYK
ncbi:unnamed protein product [Owenia fusiformis]|uniref:GCM domain-containing protein n=1 Tax=Owenia fusiformis TaxID=6347 RepID=A0A8S4N0B5_OWEFU|nr:unnamed protein product [Owenia fusiformis]